MLLGAASINYIGPGMCSVLVSKPVSGSEFNRYMGPLSLRHRVRHDLFDEDGCRHSTCIQMRRKLFRRSGYQAEVRLPSMTKSQRQTERATMPSTGNHQCLMLKVYKKDKPT